ncbi:hypothetical protein D3C78_567120 [compost metagenome]
MGRLRVGLQHPGRQLQLPVPRLRGAGAGAAARARRGRGGGAVCLGTGVDGGPAGSLREPAAPRRARPGRTLRPVRGRRLHRGAPAARARRGSGPVLHGASPGHESAGAGQRAAGAADAAAFRVRPAISRQRLAAAGAHPEDGRGIPACLRPRHRRRGHAGERHQAAHLHRSRPPPARREAAVQRSLSCAGEQRRWRLQPLPRAGADPLARGHHLRQLGHVLLSA